MICICPKQLGVEVCKLDKTQEHCRPIKTIFLISPEQDARGTEVQRSFRVWIPPENFLIYILSGNIWPEHNSGIFHFYWRYFSINSMIMQLLLRLSANVHHCAFKVQRCLAAPQVKFKRALNKSNSFCTPSTAVLPGTQGHVLIQCMFWVLYMKARKASEWFPMQSLILQYSQTFYGLFLNIYVEKISRQNVSYQLPGERVCWLFLLCWKCQHTPGFYHHTHTGVIVQSRGAHSWVQPPRL